MRLVRVVLASVSVVAAAAAVTYAPPVDAGAHPVRPDLRVVSSDPQRVTGGDALIEVTVPSKATAADVRVFAGDVDVTAAFEEVEPGVLRGLVTGLPLG